jgi:hypothetical protein
LRINCLDESVGKLEDSLTQGQQFYSGVGFAAAFFIFLVIAFFFSKGFDPGKHLILKIMTSIFGAIAGGLFTGAAMLTYEQNIPAGGKLTVSGVAGFVVFLLVWLRFPKLPEQPPPPVVLNFHFHVPEGWTFQQVLDSIAKVKNATVDYGGLTALERGAKLKDYEIHADTPEDAMRKVRDITKVTGAVRNYGVSFKQSTYFIEVK